ncbi:hypothetical protein V6N13_050318 [Hibiscus sabdariffa]|uniref:Uncharacterized protein n=2 Tax=Hibiscus sabdariffa TaxID=183260 RepID=A0ABR2P526_9ROSI
MLIYLFGFISITNFLSNGSKLPKEHISLSLNGELGFKSFGDGKAIAVDDEMDYSEQVCIVKNLDNGEAFVVNDIREDEMWNKFKEVGTRIMSI